MTASQETTPKVLRVLYIAAEADPIIKVGGLGDVTGSLPRTLLALEPEQAMGYELDVRLVIPFHPVIAERVKNPEKIASFDVAFPGGVIPAEAYETKVGDLTVYLITGDPIQRVAQVYTPNARLDGEKYTFFSLAVLELARALDWQPDILHANDWHTALAVYMLSFYRQQDPFFASTRSVLSIHNLPLMGGGTEEALGIFGIPVSQDDRLPDWGRYQPLPMGLSAADAINTVSPSYAREILTPEFGCGLQEFLQLRAGSIHGILNGLDEDAWDPATDAAIAEQFDDQAIDKRVVNKQDLIEEFNLPPNQDMPLLILVSRMAYQKGVDLAIEGLRQVADLPWQAVLLGTGEPWLENAMRQLEAEFPHRVRAIVRYDEKLSRRMYAGGDMLLMPSRYEPCGLVQMIGMRYGCVPVARATGGLRDTILDNQTPETSTGFLFEEATPQAQAAALRRAIAAFGDPDGWQARQLCGMSQNFSWQRSAEAYVQLYVGLLA